MVLKALVYHKVYKTDRDAAWHRGNSGKFLFPLSNPQPLNSGGDLSSFPALLGRSLAVEQAASMAKTE